MEEIIVAKHLSKSFGSFKAVNDVNLSMRSGECLGLLGPNGAGKSTLIRMLYGATPRSSGTLHIMGKDPEKEGSQVRAKLGVVTQTNALDEALKARENMLVFCRFHRIPKSIALNRVDELMRFMQLDHKQDAPIRSLSGGMQRRLAFVRALLCNPKLLILDEPTTGLDPAVRHLLWDKVREMHRNKRSIVLTTHYMDEAERLCDRIVIMDQGVIKASGSPRALIQEHCPGYVAIFENNESWRSILTPHLTPQFSLKQESSNLMLRAPSLDLITGFVQKLQREPEMIRPSNLEDVFLQLTGRTLSDDA